MLKVYQLKTIMLKGWVNVAYSKLGLTSYGVYSSN